MKEYTVYNKITGEITRYGTCSDETFELQAMMRSEAVLECGYRDDEYYVDVDTGEVLPRPKMGLETNKYILKSDTIDECVVSGVPEGTKVSVRMGIVPIGDVINDDGTFEFSTDDEGEYTFLFECFPYQTAEITIQANEV